MIFGLTNAPSTCYVCHDTGFNYQHREIWSLGYTRIACHLGALKAKGKSMFDFPKKTSIVMVGREQMIIFFISSYGHIFMQESLPDESYLLLRHMFQFLRSLRSTQSFQHDFMIDWLTDWLTWLSYMIDFIMLYDMHEIVL